MTKVSAFYHWVQSPRSKRPNYARVKVASGGRCTNRPSRPTLTKKEAA